MDILYPKLPFRTTLFALRSALFGALVAGVYGMIHDQISYSISPEYFTKMKFHQFAYANFGWSPRWFAAEVGFLASWWVGLIAGWLMGRVAIRAEPSAGRAMARLLNAFVILVLIAAVCGGVGVWMGNVLTRGEDILDWQSWREDLHLDNLREFAIVAYLHVASYVGAALGLIVALVYLARTKPTEPQS